MGLPWIDGRCPVCEDATKGAERTCQHCGWTMCRDCLRRHLQPTREHLEHPMSTRKCRGRIDVR